ncbi:Uncharacterised protein [uncultured archaeon]|nr:Uncharacterised protein [uncultured archaeon]
MNGIAIVVLPAASTAMSGSAATIGSTAFTAWRMENRSSYVPMSAIIIIVSIAASISMRLNAYPKKVCSAMARRSEPMKPITIASPPISATGCLSALLTSLPVMPAARSFRIRKGSETAAIRNDAAKIAPMR